MESREETFEGPWHERQLFDEPLRVGLTYNLRRTLGGADDTEAEFDSLSTIESIAEAIASFGFQVVLLEATSGLPARLSRQAVDIVFNIAEGKRGRSREAFVPALLEMMDIPYTGSDAAVMVTTLDKSLAKSVVARAGLATPTSWVVRRRSDPMPGPTDYPVFVKPLAEGSSKGIDSEGVVADGDACQRRVDELLERYPEGVLIETYLPGREFTVALLSDADTLGSEPQSLSPMEIVYRDSAQTPVYSYGIKQQASPSSVRFEVPAEVDADLEGRLRQAAEAAFRALRCRDVARIDLRLDQHGGVQFLECNPLPGLVPGFSDLPVIAEAAGLEFRALIGAILAPALARRRLDTYRSGTVR
jgi:D-alanine-D-alanine ligase